MRGAEHRQVQPPDAERDRLRQASVALVEGEEGAHGEPLVRASPEVPEPLPPGHEQAPGLRRVRQGRGLLLPGDQEGLGVLGLAGRGRESEDAARAPLPGSHAVEGAHLHTGRGGQLAQGRLEAAARRAQPQHGKLAVLLAAGHTSAQVSSGDEQDRAVFHDHRRAQPEQARDQRHLGPRAAAAQDQWDAQVSQRRDRRPCRVVVPGQRVEEAAVDAAEDHSLQGHDSTTRRGRAAASG
jgi:hypothetical protein